MVRLAAAAEAAVRIEANPIVARADGRGACHTVASTGTAMRRG
jgi:hypothetical protein